MHHAGNDLGPIPARPQFQWEHCPIEKCAGIYPLLLSLLFLCLFIYIERNFALELIIPLYLLRNRTMLAASLNYCFDHVSAFGILYYIPVHIPLLGKSTTPGQVEIIAKQCRTGHWSSGSRVLNARIWWILSSQYCDACVRWIRAAHISFAEHTMESILHFRHSGPWLWVNACNQPHYRHQFRSSRGISTCHVRVVRVSLCGVDSWCYICFSGILKCPKKALWKRIGHVSNANTIIDSVRGNFQEISHVDPPIRQAVLDSYMVALVAVFCTTFGINCLAGIVNLFMREHKLHSMLSRI